MELLRSTVVVAVISVVSVASGHAQSCAETPAGIVSWWPAEVSTEDVVGDNDGALQDNAAYSQGVVGMAFELDGSSDHVLVPDDPSLDLQEFTIEGWVRLSATGDLFVATKSGTTGQLGYEMATDRNGRPRFTINGGNSAADIVGPDSIADGSFHHFSATYKTPTAKLYLDGVLVAREVLPSEVTYEAGSGFHIGARQLAGIPGYWPGQIDELTVYSRVLCGVEVETIHDAGSEGKCDNGVTVECPIFIDDFNLGDTGEWSKTHP